MAKKQRNRQVSCSFHYLVKSQADDENEGEFVEEGFTPAEFRRVLLRIADIAPLDENDDDVIAAIKSGKDLPFIYHEEAEPRLHFGDFEGAYYGTRYRNNRLGVVEAQDLNMRQFHYILTLLRDGKILVGTTYHGMYGDYGGLRDCLSYILRGNYKVVSKVLKNVAVEIGDGEPVELRLNYRKSNDRAERAPIFGSSGIIAVEKSDYDFRVRVRYFLVLSVLQLVILLTLTFSLRLGLVVMQAGKFLETDSWLAYLTWARGIISQALTAFLLFLFLEWLYTFYRLSETILALLRTRTAYLEARAEGT